MTALRALVRMTARGRWRSHLAIVVVLALGLGAGLALVAGARRTTSAYPRFLEAADAPDLLIDHGAQTAEDTARLGAAIGAVDGVAATHDEAAFTVARLGADGELDISFPSQFLAPTDDRPSPADEPALVEGRRPDPDRADEVMIDPALAEARDLGVGDRVTLAWTSNVEAEKSFAGEPFSTEPVSFTVVGIGVRTDGAITDDTAGEPTMMGTAAFARTHLDGTTFHRLLVATDGTVATDDLVEELRAVTADVLGSSAEEVFVVDRSVAAARAERAVRPVGISLAAFGLAVLLVTMVLAGQALARQMAGAEVDLDTVRALGVTPGSGLAWVMAVPAAVVLAGVAGAVVVSVALSPLSPVGVVRAVEPTPGIDVDLPLLALAVSAIVALLILRCLLAGALLLRVQRDVPSRGPSRIAAWTSSLPVAWGLAVRSALEPGRGRARASARATLVIATVAVIGLAALGTVDAGRRRLADDPSLHGWTWDAAIQVSGGYGTVDLEALRADDRIGDLAVAQYLSVAVEDRAVPTMVLSPVRGTVAPTLTEGRAPEGLDEVVLGATTLAAIGAQVGDRVTVEAEEGPEPMLVTGVAVFPALGLSDNERPTLSVGMWAERPLPGREVQPQGGQATALVRLAPGVDRGEGLDHLRDRYDVPALDSVVYEQARPADLAGFARLGVGPLVAVAAFALAAVATLLHGVVVSARRRRPEHGLLRAIGFERRQIRTIVVGEALTTLAVALLIGLPLGIAAGRAAWGAVAEAIGVAVAPIVPVGALAVLCAVLVAAVALAARWPAGDAARHTPSDLLAER